VPFVTQWHSQNGRGAILVAQADGTPSTASA